MNLEDIVVDQRSSTISLVNSMISFKIFKFLQNDLKAVMEVLTLEQIKFYSYKVLEALEYSHSKGIMHRDIKPGNITIDLAQKELRVIDWGLAEFYHPYKEYNCRVSTRPMKGPELLLNYGFYDYSLDMWCFGMMLGALIFKRNFLIHSKDDDEQLIRMTSLFGKERLMSYCEKYKLSPNREVQIGLKTLFFSNIELEQH